MNYELAYNNIINNAIKDNRKKGCGVYYEKHHILPKCLGGDDIKTNLVLLTAKEHYICHKLLCEIYPENNKLAFALWNMCRPNNRYQKRYIVSARAYKEAREHLSNTYKKRTAWNKGLKLSDKQLVNHATHKPGYQVWNKGKPSKYKGIKRSMATCIYCGKVGGAPQIKQWHNDNCKSNK
jgi:hypothetical protein